MFIKIKKVASYNNDSTNPWVKMDYSMPVVRQLNKHLEKKNARRSCTCLHTLVYTLNGLKV